MGSEREPPGVAVLYNACHDLIKGEPRDVLADEGVEACARAVYAAFERAGYPVVQVPVHDDVVSALSPYPPTDWIVFNLGEGMEGRLFEEARIAWALEAMGYCFTGSGGNAIARSVHKARAKTLLADNGVSTPPGWLFRHSDEVPQRSGVLTYPLIVKPVAEDASIGVGPEAVVRTERALQERVGYVVERYRQAALAEAFVEGREFNIALWGDPARVLPLAEIDFSAIEDPYARIVSFAAKWEVDSFEYHHTPVLCPASVDPALGDHVSDVARRAWITIGCRGYARVDMRLGKDDRLHVVEVNCNPDLSPDAGFYRAAEAAGYSYEDMVVHIVDVARRQLDAYEGVGFERRRAGHPSHDGGGRCLHAYGSELRQRALERVSG
jgi:D-alanine-D-alanine ligase